MEKNLIAVVDDDRSICRMLERVIIAAGHNVAAFTSAEDFLNSGKVQDSSCLVLDVDLPGMSGIELQQQLKKASPRIPIIFMSGQKNEQKRNQALKEGAVTFFQKPFSIDLLLAAIRSLEPRFSDS